MESSSLVSFVGNLRGDVQILWYYASLLLAQGERGELNLKNRFPSLVL